MSDHNEGPRSLQFGTLQLMDLVEKTVMARSLEDLADTVLPPLAAMLQADSSLIYVACPHLPAPHLLQYGFDPENTSELVKFCERKLLMLSGGADLPPHSQLPVDPMIAPESLSTYPLWDDTGCVGLIGLDTARTAPPLPLELWNRLLRLLGLCICRLDDWARAERQLAHLNSYLTISSMLTQPLGLHELLETALYFCMELSSASEASVMLLDDEKENFRFYHVEGRGKSVLMGAKFPADRGLAGHVLRTRKSEVVNDVQTDPRFYGKIDSDCGFQTHSMIAIPLVAGEEPVGVLEVLNKATDNCFTEEEHRQLLTIADEIAFAIRNAKVFEYVVNNYCKQRQGQNSCKGCKRPLGSWTPCVKYREATI